MAIALNATDLNTSSSVGLLGAVSVVAPASAPLAPPFDAAGGRPRLQTSAGLALDGAKVVWAAFGRAFVAAVAGGVGAAGSSHCATLTFGASRLRSSTSALVDDSAAAEGVVVGIDVDDTRCSVASTKKQTAE